MKSPLCRNWDWKCLVIAQGLGLLIACPVGAQSGNQKEADQDPGQTGPVASSTAAANLYSDAANLQNNDEFAVAAEEWQRFLKEFPNDPLVPQVRHYLGVCQMQLRKFSDAITSFSTVVKKHPDFESIEESLVNLGWCQYSVGIAGDKKKLEDGVKSFTSFLKQHPDSDFADQALFYLGECHYLSGRPEKAIAAYGRLVEEKPKSKLRPDALYALGVALQESKKHDGARKTFQGFLREYPAHELLQEIQMRLAETLIEGNEFAKAAGLLGNVAEDTSFSDADQARYRQAYCLGRLKRYREAADLYARVVSDFADSQLHDSATIAAARAYYRAEEFDQAGAWFAQAAKSDGSHAAEAAHWLSRIALKAGDIDRARQILEDAIPKASDSSFLPNLKLDYGDALFASETGKPQSLEVYLKIVASHAEHPVAPQALYNAAYAAMELGDYAKARELAADFVQRFKTNHLRADADYVSAESQLLAGDFGAAEEAYATLIQDYSTHRDAGLWVLRHAVALQAQKKHGELRQHLSSRIKSLSRPELVAEAKFLLGSSLAELGKQEEAVQALQESLSTDAPWDRATDAKLRLAQVLSSLGRSQEAKTHLVSLVDDDSTKKQRDRILFQLAETIYQSGDLADAQWHYEVIVSQHRESPLFPNALFGLAWSFLRQGQATKAMPHLDELIKAHPDLPITQSAYRARAMCRQQTRDFAAALKDIETFLQSAQTDEDKADGLYLRGLSEAGLERFQAAQATFGTVLEQFPKYRSRDRVFYERAWAFKSGGQDDQAIEHFSLLATKHPRSRLAAEANYHIGEKLYTDRKYSDAETRYEAVLAAQPQPGLLEKAAYKRAWSAYKQEEYPRARELFQQQLSDVPEGPLSPDATFMIGECWFQQKEYDQAIASYRAASEQGLTENAKVLRGLHGGQAASQQEKWQDSVTWLKPIVADHKDSPYYPQAAYELGWALQNLDKLDQAAQLYADVIMKSRSEVGARAQFMLGELHFGRKQFNEALREFQRLMYGFDGDQADATIKPWQAKAGLEAGRCAAILAGQTDNENERMAQLERAKKYYRHVIDKHPQTAEAGAAKKQLDKFGA